MVNEDINLEDFILREDADFLKLRKDARTWLKKFNPHSELHEIIYSCGTGNVIGENNPNYLKILKAVQKLQELGEGIFFDDSYLNISVSGDNWDSIKGLSFPFGSSKYVHVMGDAPFPKYQMAELYKVLKPYIVEG